MDKSAVARARGIGIIAVVYGHAAPGYWIPVYLFHMPLFFLLGGLTMNRERSWRQVLRFVLVDLLLFTAAATFVYQLVALALDPLVPIYHRFDGLHPSIFTTDILVYNGRAVLFALTAWFLVAYAAATLLTEAIIRLVPPALENRVLPLVAVILLVIGIEVLAPQFVSAPENWYFNPLSQVCVGSAFMLAGYLLQRATRLLQLLFHPVALVVMPLAFTAIVILIQPPVPNMVSSEYPLGLGQFVLCSILGIACTLQLAHALKLNWLVSLGRASKHVMMHHLFVFALVNLAFVAAGLMTLDQITSIYSKFDLPSTWLLYTALGITAPWLGITLWHRLRKAIRPAPTPATTT